MHAADCLPRGTLVVAATQINMHDAASTNNCDSHVAHVVEDSNSAYHHRGVV
jgi:hypothetical protein